MYPHDLNALQRMEELRREHWHHPAERHRRMLQGKRRGGTGARRRETS
jgi:hypothetical protein